MPDLKMTIFYRHALIALALLAANADTEAQTQFEQKCAAPGVVKCETFDTTAALANVFQAHDFDTFAIDESIRANGEGSLRLEIPSNSVANGGGQYYSSLGGNFVAGDSFFVAFKQRFSQEMFSQALRDTRSSWKQVILHAENASCSQVELTTVNAFFRGFPEMYTACGARTLRNNLGGGNYQLQQGDYDCRYQQINTSDCARFRVDEWMTFYYEIRIGTWGADDSSIKAYVAFEGEPLRQFIDMPNFRLNSLSDVNRGYDWITLGPYMTNKDSSVAHPPARTWYDDLIVSTAPIFAPGEVPGVAAALGPASVPPQGLQTNNN